MGYEVDTDAMRAHAQDIAGHANRIGEATAAAKRTMLVDDSFGVLYAWAIPPSLAVEVAGVAVVAGAEALMAGTGLAVLGVAEGYDALDEAFAGKISELLGKL